MIRKLLSVIAFGCLSLFTVAKALSESESKSDSVFFMFDTDQHSFLQVLGGMNHSMSENVRFYPLLQAERPALMVTYGQYFYPQFGMRASFGWLNHISFVDKNTLNNMPAGFESDYKFQMAQVFLDGLLDLGSLCFGPKERKSRLAFVLGLGYLHTFGFSDMAKKWTERHNMLVEKYGENYRNSVVDGVDANGKEVRAYAYPVDTKAGNYLAGHFGFLYSYRISKNWDFNLEATFNGTDDAYNGVRCRRVYDSYINGLAGLTYRFNRNKKKYQFIPLPGIFEPVYYTETIKDTLYVDDPQVKIVENVKLDETIQTIVQFYIDKDNITEDQKQNVWSVALFMERHPDIKIRVIGYADVQTAYPAYNLKLSERRAKNVYSMLVNECGIDPSRLTVEWKGDTDQPFDIVNEWNRSVVFKIEQ